jgi:hypothetical protein
MLRSLFVVVLCLGLVSVPSTTSFAQCDAQHLLKRGPGHGGCCGDGQWDDSSAYDVLSNPITKVEIWSDSEVRGIRVTYGNIQGPIHGGKGSTPQGTLTPIVLQPGEYINYAAGQSGSRNDKICLGTNLHSPQCFGGGGGDQPYSDELQGRPLRAIAGASGSSLDQILYISSPFSQIDVNTIKYDQSVLNQAIQGAPFKVFTDSSQDTSTSVPLGPIVSSATSQLTHTESLQLAKTVTSSSTTSVSTSLTLAATAVVPGSKILSDPAVVAKFGAPGGGGGGPSFTGTFTYSWAEQISNSSQQTVSDSTASSTSWSVSYTLPGGQKSNLVTVWKQVNLDLPITYNLVYYNDDAAKTEVCRQNITGTLAGSGSSDVTHLFGTAPIGQKVFALKGARAGNKVDFNK